MAINLESLSLTSVFNSIVSFFKSQAGNSRWKDLSTNSEGVFLIRLLSSIFSTLSYRIVAQSRENYLSTAALPSSNIGISVNLGYSPFRGSNLKRKIQITPSSDYIFPRLSVIGTYSENYDIIALEDVTAVANTPIEVNTVIGKVKEATITAGTSAIKIFSLFTTGISEDYTLYVDSTEVPTTKVIKEMANDKYLVRTNPYKSVDIVYLNTYPNFQYKYGTSSELTIRYVELEDIEVAPYTTSMFSWGTLTDTTTISTFLSFETVEEMKVRAPLDHELQNIIRSKADYANRIAEIVPAVKDVSFKALTPTYTLTSYLKNNLTLLTNSEKEQVQEILKEENFFGTPLPDITVPRREVAHLQIDLALTNKYKNISDIKLDIENILENYYDYALGLTFDVHDLERNLEALSYVKYARVNHIINERETGANYQIGYILNKDNSYYTASKILGISGSDEPNWNVPLNNVNTIDTGLETIDGSIVWRAFKALPNMPSNTYYAWQANFQYGIGDYVYTPSFPNYMFKCVDLIKSSGVTMPDITYAEEGDFITDGAIVWVVKTKDADAPIWTSYTNYSLGDSVNVNSTTNASEDFSLECVSYSGTTGTDSELSFELSVYPILATTTNSFEVAKDKTFYFRVNDIISAAHSGGYTNFSIASAVYNSVTNRTVITVNQPIDSGITYTQLITEERGTRDGQILWTLIDDIEKVKYNWNSYVTFDYDLNIIGG